MSNRKSIVVMSWAMRQNRKKEAISFSKKLVELLGEDHGVEKIVFPSMGTLSHVANVINGSAIGLGTQNIAPVAHGMFSGEYSIDSLIDEGGKYVELGHWERRKIFHESDELINQKVLLTLNKGLTPVICVGEISETENMYVVETQLYRQLFNDLLQVDEADVERLIIAYTPMWTVGKTRAANVPHIHEAAKIIRKILIKLFGTESGEKVRIIYGGSVSPENAQLIVQNNEIDGVFVGRFGSDPERYAEVVKVVEENHNKEIEF